MADSQQGADRPQPNLLYIHSDQHNPAVTGCYGDSLVETPHLDGLAARGVRCTEVYCPSPVCVASRMATLAGQYPSDIEVWTNSHILDPGVPTLAHAMGAAGYRPVLAGRMHAIGSDQLHGYAERPIGDHSSNWPGSGDTPKKMTAKLERAGAGQSSYEVHDDDVTAEAVHFLNRLGVGRRAGLAEDPFSLTVGLMLPHDPYLARRQGYEWYRQRIGPPTVRDPFDNDLHPFIRWWRERNGWQAVSDEWVLGARAAYWALISAMDSMIGQILQALTDNGLAENTLVVYSSDHGDQMREHDLWMKRTFYEGSVRVPAILAWPGVLPEGAVCGRVMSALDLNATMLEALAAPALPNSRGHSALELLRAEGEGEWEDVALSEYALKEGVVQRMVRKDEWKLIYHWKERPQLFNVAEDRLEQTDRAEDPSCRGIVEELTERALDGWDPENVAQRLQERCRESEMIRDWARQTKAPEQFRWEAQPEMTFKE